MYPNKMQRYTVYFIWKLLYMFRVVPPSIITSANNCIYSICYLSHRYCYLPLSWKSWNWFEYAVGGVRRSWYAGLGSTQTCIPDGHPHRVTYTRCRVDTINSPDNDDECSKHVEIWNKSIRKRNCASS
jgi:hypothetical protein